MKKKYKILTGIILTEFISALILKKLGISLENNFLALVLASIFFVTILISLYMLSKDEDVSPKKRKFCKIFFYFMLFCTTGAIIGNLILLIF